MTYLVSSGVSDGRIDLTSRIPIVDETRNLVVTIIGDKDGPRSNSGADGRHSE